LPTPDDPAPAPGLRDRSLADTVAFFGRRAQRWEERFPDDGPLFDAAVQALAPPRGGTVLDAGCGTGRGLAPLRAAVGPHGRVVGLDVTPEMLAEAGRRGRRTGAALVLGDAQVLPFTTGSFDACLAAGLVSHLPDPPGGLRELARVCHRGATLALFHPTGRAALAARHQRPVDPDDIRAEPHIRAALGDAGWTCTSVEDAEDRYLVLAVRR
jgi:SAM-dependent methyltransferase